MKHLLTVAAAALLCAASIAFAQTARPFDGRAFSGRIAYSADGNHNDPDDWAASPMALAILAGFGVQDRLVHFDYNCILPQTNPEWEAIHAASVLGAAERFHFDRKVFHDCRKDLDAAVDSIARAINESSAEDPLYFIIAGPMEAPFRGIEKSDPSRRQFVYCISHSAWNDGFAQKYTFTHTKRSVIDSGVHWVQIQDQNRLLSRSRYGEPAKPQEFEAYFWMRDAADPAVRFLWDRMVVSTRPDPSDAGMAYFLLTGDEEADPRKLQQLLLEHRRPTPASARLRVRLEAENFTHLDGYELEYRNDRSASHRLSVRPTAEGAVRALRTRLSQPYVAARGRYDLELRAFDEQGGRGRFTVSVNGVVQGEAIESPGDGRGWINLTWRDVQVALGDEIAIEAAGAPARLDYVQLTAVDGAAKPAASPK